VGVILNPLAAALAAKAHLTVLVAGAVLVGAAGGVYAATSAPSHSVTVTTVAEKTHAEKAKAHKDQQKTNGRTAKPTKSPPPAGAVAETHGSCVSAVARDTELVGGRNNNHGGAVSAAAHSCAGSAAKSHKDKKPDGVGKPAKPTKPAKPAKPAHPGDDEQSTTTPAS
jgi:hypothetical protein